MKGTITSRKDYDQIAIDELERVGNALNLPKVVIDEAARIFTEAAKAGFTRGRSIMITVAVSIYVACREMKVPRTIEEISRATKIDSVELGKAYRALLSKVKIEVPVMDPKDYVERIGRMLNLPDEIIKKAEEIVEQVKKSGYTVGKDPAGIAGAAIYIASMDDGKVTQKQIAEVANVTEVTIRSRYKEIMDLLGLKKDAKSG